MTEWSSEYQHINNTSPRAGDIKTRAAATSAMPKGGGWASVPSTIVHVHDDFARTSGRAQRENPPKKHVFLPVQAAAVLVSRFFSCLAALNLNQTTYSYPWPALSANRHLRRAAAATSNSLSNPETSTIRSAPPETPRKIKAKTKVSSTHFESSQGIQLSMASDHSPTKTGRQAQVWYRSMEV